MPYAGFESARIEAAEAIGWCRRLLCLTSWCLTTPSHGVRQGYISMTSPGIRTKASHYRTILSVSSFFKLPEQGMKDYELLSQGTGFCLSGPPALSTKVILLSCSHVLAPYRWQQYFKKPWLKFVKDEHVERRIKIWTYEAGNPEAGRWSNEARIEGTPAHHSCLDLCIIPLENGIVETCALVPYDERDDGEVMIEKENLTFLGFPSTDTINIDKKACLMHIQGKALLSFSDTQGRTYAKTKERLVVGMSGGPVLDGSGRFCGLFQGILPPAPRTPEEERQQADGGLDPVLRPLQIRNSELHAAFIPQFAIREYINSAVIK